MLQSSLTLAKHRLNILTILSTKAGQVHNGVQLGTSDPLFLRRAPQALLHIEAGVVSNDEIIGPQVACNLRNYVTLRKVGASSSSEIPIGTCSLTQVAKDRAPRIKEA